MDIILEAKIKNKFAVETGKAFIFDIVFNKLVNSGSFPSGGSIPVKHNHRWEDIDETPNLYPPMKHLHSLSEVGTLSSTIEGINGEITDMSEQLIGLQAGAILIGTVNYSASQLTNVILHDMAMQLKEDIKIGYTIIGNDGVRWWCEQVSVDSTTSKWNNIGQSMVGKATNNSEGLVKGSLANNKVSVDIDGTMKVNNLDAVKVNSLNEFIENEIEKVITVGTNLLSYSGGEIIAMTNWVAPTGIASVISVLPGEPLFGKQCFKMEITNSESYAALEQIVPITDIDSAYTLSFWHKNNITITGQISAYITEYDAYMNQTSISKIYESESNPDGWDNAEAVHKIKNRSTRFLGAHFKLSKAGVGVDQSIGYLTDIILTVGDKYVWHPNKDKYVLRTGGTFIGKIFAPAYGRSSDIRLKENVFPISNKTLDLIKNIVPVEFNLLNEDKLSYGFIAQEVEMYFPSLVSVNDDGYKSLDYDQVQNIQIAYLMKKIEHLEMTLSIITDSIKL